MLGKEPSSSEAVELLSSVRDGTPGREKPLALKASFIVLFLVAEHPIMYKTLKAVVLKVLAYEPDYFFFSSGGTGTCKANLLSPNVLKRCP